MHGVGRQRSSPQPPAPSRFHFPHTRRPPSSSVTLFHPNIWTNHAHPLLTLLACVAAACSSSKIDSGLVGTWELNVPNADGVARWVWDIHADGTYAFHAEGPGNVPSHSGTFEAKGGKYTLRATTMVWVDDGTYQLIHGDTLSATGKLGRAAWTRVRPAAAPDADRFVSQARHGRKSGQQREGACGWPGRVYRGNIYDFLSHNASTMASSRHH